MKLIEPFIEINTSIVKDYQQIQNIHILVPLIV
jgi:hypothetical protein